jgi:hypothetical protein
MKGGSRPGVEPPARAGAGRGFVDEVVFEELELASLRQCDEFDLVSAQLHPANFPEIVLGSSLTN